MRRLCAAVSCKATDADERIAVKSASNEITGQSSLDFRYNSPGFVLWRIAKGARLQPKSFQAQCVKVYGVTGVKLATDKLHSHI